MKKAAKYFEGEHDFSGFKASGTSSKSSVRTIYKAEIIQENEKIKIELTGNGFLYNMVRIIAGTLIEIGNGQYPPERMKSIVEACDRSAAGPTAPACGLTLIGIRYE